MDAPIAIALGAGVLLLTVVAAVLLVRARGTDVDDELMFRPEMPAPVGDPLPPPIGTPIGTPTGDVAPAGPAPDLPPQEYPDEAFAPRQPDPGATPPEPAAPEPPVEHRTSEPPPSRYPLDTPTVIRHRGAEPVDPMNPPTRPRRRPPSE